MGLTNVLLTFLWVMELVLEQLDDGRSLEDQLFALGEVFTLISAAGLHLNARQRTIFSS